MDTAARRRDEIAALGLLERRPPDVIAHLLNAARLLTGATDAQLNVLTEDSQLTLVDARGDSKSMPLSESVCGRVVQQPDLDVQVPDASEDPRYADLDIVERGDVIGYAASKLVTAEGVVLGTVCVFSDQRLEMPPHLVEALQQVGLSAMAALEARRTARSVEDALRTSQSRFQLLDRTNEHLSSFSGQVAHDLQGPLSTIIFALEWLRDELVDGDAPELLRTALSSSVRLQRTVASLLELAQLGGRPALVRVQVDSLVRDVLQDLGAPRRAVRVEVADLPVVDADPELLRALVLNLVDNAFKYAAGAADPLVRVSGDVTPHAWRLTVEDNGPGVAPDQRSRIFEPMARGVDVDPRVRGSGIGLDTCRRVAEVHGGRIEVGESSLGGACFWLEVPTAPVPAPASA